MSCHYSVEIKFPPKVKQCFTRHLQTRYCTDCDKENTILFRSQKYGKMYFLIRCSLYVFYLRLKKSIQRIQSLDLCCYNTQRFFDGPGTYVYSCFRHCPSCKVKLLCFQMVVKLDAFFTHLITQEMPAERTVIYNRRTPSAGPMYYADDSLEAELNMGRDIKIQTEGNDSSSVASYELVFECSVYLLEQW